MTRLARQGGLVLVSVLHDLVHLGFAVALLGGAAAAWYQGVALVWVIVGAVAAGLLYQGAWIAWASLGGPEERP